MCLSFAAKANVQFEAPKVQSATVSDVKFTVTSQTYKIIFKSDEISWGTRMFAKYETKSTGQVEDYAVVQFIRGCHFNNYVENGKIVYVDNISREFFNEMITYKHPEWVIDSVDLDPMYNNTPEGFEKWNTRHGLYRWNRKHNFDQNGEVLFKDEKPKKPYLYVMDHPGTAFFQDRWAKNISLEFKVCLYKTKDIPVTAAPNDLNFAKAVQCFDWNSSFIYDHFKSTFSRPTGLHPHCVK